MDSDAMSVDPMYVIGIDTGLERTGIGIIARIGETCRARTYVVATSAPELPTDAAQFLRIESMVNGVSAINPQYPANLGLLEAPAWEARHGRSHERSAVWYGVFGVLYRLGSPVGKVAPKTLKRWAVGRGGSPADPVEKRHVVNAMREMWPDVSATHSELRHHECEGLAMAHMCAQRLRWPVPLLPHHVGPLRVVKWPPGH